MNTHIIYVCFFTVQHLVMKQNTFVSKSQGPEARRKKSCFLGCLVSIIMLLKISFRKKNTEINRHHFVYHEILAPKKTEGCFDLVTSKLKSHMTPVSLLQAAGLRWHHCLSAHWLFLVGPLTLGFLRKDVVWIGWLVGWEMGECFFLRQDDTKLMSMSLFFHSFNLYGYIKVIYIYKCIMCV